MSRFAASMHYYICLLLIYCCLNIASSQQIVFPNKDGTFSIIEKPKPQVIDDDKPFIKDINSLSTIDEFLEYYGIDKSSISEDPNDDEGIATRLRSSPSEVTELPMANCALVNITVALEIPEEEEEFFPNYVRVPRCQGCCNLLKYECLPLASETIKVEIAKLSKQQKGSRRKRNAKLVSVDVVIHTQCDCGCKKMEDSCNSDIHNYDKDTCNCQCKNIDEEDKCLSKGTHKWNNEKCACECHNSRPCSSGHYYDHSSCSCELI